MNGKKLYKKQEGKMIEGVCAGLADYTGLDVTLVRLLWIIFSAAVGSGIIAYIICAIVFPKERDVK